MKKVLPSILVCFLSTCLVSNAQFSLQWDVDYNHTFSLGYSNEGRKVVVDQANEFVYTLSDVTSDLDPSGIVTGQTYSYTVLNQYDLTGNSLNTEVINIGNHSISGFDNKSGFGLELDPSGNVYVGYMNYDASTDFDVNISKFNSSLTLLWTYKFNPVTADIANDLKVSSGGVAYAITKSSTSAGAIRYRVIKATSAGIATVPFYNFSAYPDFLTSLAIDGSQNIYITGYRLLNGVKSILTASVSNAGTLRWSRTDNCGTNTGDDFARHITIGFDGHVYITGSSQGTVQHGNDVVTMKFNSLTGKKFWDNFINQNLNDGGYFVSVPAADLVYVCWTAANNVYVDQLFSSSSLTGRRALYSPIPVSTYTSLTGATITDIKVSSRNNVYVTGNIGAISSGQQFMANYLVKINFSTRSGSPVEKFIPVEGSFSNTYKSSSIALHEATSQVLMLRDEYHDNSNHAQEIVGLESYFASGSFRTADQSHDLKNKLASNGQLVSISPNPVISKTYVKCNEAFSKIEVFDISGRLIQSISPNEDNAMQVELDLSELPSGFYTVRTNGSNGFVQIDKVLKD